MNYGTLVAPEQVRLLDIMATAMAMQQGELILATDAEALKPGDHLTLDIAGAGPQPFSIKRPATEKEWRNQRKMLLSLGAKNLPDVPARAGGYRYYAITTD